MRATKYIHDDVHLVPHAGLRGEARVCVNIAATTNAKRLREQRSQPRHRTVPPLTLSKAKSASREQRSHYNDKDPFRVTNAATTAITITTTKTNMTTATTTETRDVAAEHTERWPPFRIA